MPVGWYVVEPPLSGVEAATLKKAIASMSGQQPEAGPLVASLKKRSASMSGLVAPAGGIVAATKRLSVQINGKQNFTGTMAASTKKPTANMRPSNNGFMSATMKKATASLGGQQPFTGAIAATVKKALASIVGAHIQSGSMTAINKKRAAAIAGKSAQIIYNAPFAAVPTGLVNIKSPSGSGSTTLNGTTLREAGSSASNAFYHTIGQLPDKFESAFFSTKVRLAAASGSDRGVGAGASNDNGSVIVYGILYGTVNGEIITLIGGTGGTRTVRASFNIKATDAGDTVEMVPSVNSGVVTWTVYKNGVATGLTWTDSTHIADLPGKKPVIAFRHSYATGQYYSPGIDSIVATDLS